MVTELENMRNTSLSACLQGRNQTRATYPWKVSGRIRDTSKGGSGYDPKNQRIGLKCV